MCSREDYLRKKVMNGRTHSATEGRDEKTRELKRRASQERRKARKKKHNVT